MVKMFTPCFFSLFYFYINRINKHLTESSKCGQVKFVSAVIIAEGHILDSSLSILSIMLYYEHVNFDILEKHINVNIGTTTNVHDQGNFINDRFLVLVKDIFIPRILFGCLG